MNDIMYTDHWTAKTLESCLDHLSESCFTSFYSLTGIADKYELSEENIVRVMMLKDWFTSFANEMAEVLGE